MLRQALAGDWTSQNSSDLDSLYAQGFQSSINGSQRENSTSPSVHSVTFLFFLVGDTSMSAS